MLGRRKRSKRADMRWWPPPHPSTRRALGCLGIEVLPWRWNGTGASWEALIDVNATKWMVTVPPRTGMDEAVDFHAELQTAAEKANVALLMWTSSTAVYDPQKEEWSERRRDPSAVQAHRGGSSSARTDACSRCGAFRGHAVWRVVFRTKASRLGADQEDTCERRRRPCAVGA